MNFGRRRRRIEDMMFGNDDDDSQPAPAKTKKQGGGGLLKNIGAFLKRKTEDGEMLSPKPPARDMDASDVMPEAEDSKDLGVAGAADAKKEQMKQPQGSGLNIFKKAKGGKNK
uniref:Uncharacterized protein n=1 Tax=Favella ehrenbergii TaxID=182087 RepID=A0A7S3I0Z2_9SPIT|mmetsp:Transcript_2446/g.3099  ORF Transcript_2446/g.3099 Transcript_2446/m.3099 type:complete len:113 (+) Transcript_2446:2143-2481(+)